MLSYKADCDKEKVVSYLYSTSPITQVLKYFESNRHFYNRGFSRTLRYNFTGINPESEFSHDFGKTNQLRLRTANTSVFKILPLHDFCFITYVV